MSLQKLEVEEVIHKRKVLEDQFQQKKQAEKNYLTKRKSVVKIVNNNSLFPGLLTSYSTKFIRKLSDKSKSPIAEPKLVKKKSTENPQRERRKSFIANSQCQQPQNTQKNPRHQSPPKIEASSSILLSNSLHEEIKRIKTLSRFMLDMKLPSALPSRTKKQKEKQKKITNWELENQEVKPLIEVKMQRKNGFLRPIMLVRDPLQRQNEQKQSTEKKLKSLIMKPKQKLKTAPEIVEFGLHIKSHQQVFDQENRLRQTKRELIKRFRSTWTRKLSKSGKKLPEVEVSPWIVTQAQHD